MSINEKIHEALLVLGLKEGASLPEIKMAFRKLALQYHPDRCCESKKESCKEKFIEVNKAREYLENYYTGNYTYVDEKEQAQNR